MNKDRTEMSAVATAAAAARTSEYTVARYDDDYPLLFGEPARQPAWPPARQAMNLPQPGSPAGASSCGSSCRTCGRCRG